MKKTKTTPCPPPKKIRELINLKNPAFSELLDDNDIEAISKEGQVNYYGQEDVIVRQHEPSDSLYLIIEGRCTVYVNDRLISHMETGDLFGEMGVIQETPRSATIIAIEPTKAIRIDAATFKKMLYNQKMSNWLLNLLTDRLKRTSTDAARFQKEMEEIRMDQMELARVQRSLLPKELPKDSRFRLHVLYSPCAYAGGDYYDAFMIDDHQLFLITADVTGHGAQASISMAIVRSFVHQSNIGKTPGTILKRLNNYLFCYGPSQHFVTAQVAVIDLKKKRIQFSYAGHPPILHMRGESCNPLKGTRNFFLRFQTEVEYKTSTLSLESGDRLAFYTDGVIETFNPEGEMYNVEGLSKYISKTKDKPISSVTTYLETDLHQFRQGSPVEDDITFMVCEMV